MKKKVVKKSVKKPVKKALKKVVKKIGRPEKYGPWVQVCMRIPMDLSNKLDKDFSTGKFDVKADLYRHLLAKNI